MIDLDAFPFPGEEAQLAQDNRKELVPVSNGHSIRYSAELGKLAEALAKAQLEYQPIVKESENPAYKRGNRVSKYADLSAVIDATRPSLAKNGLVVLQMPSMDLEKKTLTMTTKLLHSSGQWVENDLTVSAIQQGGRFDIQSIMSAQTYCRRYQWQSLTGCAAEDDSDDDGNSAAGIGTAEAQTEVAKAKLAAKGVTIPSLFYIHHAESDTYEIQGTDELKAANKDVLKKYWDKTANTLVLTGEQLEDLKYVLEQRHVPLSQLKEK